MSAFSRCLPAADAIDEYHIEEELDVAPDADAQLVGEEGRAHHEPAGQQHEEGGVVAGELQLGLLAVREVPVHLPRGRQLLIVERNFRMGKLSGTGGQWTLPTR